jgi:hypothetical protein
MKGAASHAAPGLGFERHASTYYADEDHCSLYTPTKLVLHSQTVIGMRTCSVARSSSSGLLALKSTRALLQSNRQTTKLKQV